MIELYLLILVIYYNEIQSSFLYDFTIPFVFISGSGIGVVVLMSSAFVVAMIKFIENEIHKINFFNFGRFYICTDSKT